MFYYLVKFKSFVDDYTYRYINLFRQNGFDLIYCSNFNKKNYPEYCIISSFNKISSSFFTINSLCFVFLGGYIEDDKLYLFNTCGKLIFVKDLLPLDNSYDLKPSPIQISFLSKV